MSTIGVYDSGIGGLTTLAYLLDEFSGNDFYYYADNAHHPFGNKTEKELVQIVDSAINKMRKRCDFIVLACNTASIICDKTDVFKLLPPIEYADENTLLMATDKTIEHINNDKIKSAETSSLASQIEIQASLSYRKNALDMSALYTYLRVHLYKFKGVERVILGCSHYPYCKNEIRKILGEVEFADGNKKLICELKQHCKKQYGESKISFDFSSQNEEKKYRKILSILGSENRK